MGRNGRQRHGACGISLENGVLNPKYKFDTYSKDTDAYTPGNEKYVGEGNHNMTVADVDDDGNNEFMSATLCYEVNDEDKLMPKWYGGRQHGDALHEPFPFYSYWRRRRPPSFTIYKVSNPHFKWGFANNPSGVLYWLLPLAGLANATILTCPHWGLSSFLTYHCRTYRYFPVL